MTYVGWDMVLFKILALYKSFTYLLTYLLTYILAHLCYGAWHVFSAAAE